MRIILTDEIMDVQAGVMFFTKQRLAEIIKFIESGDEQHRIPDSTAIELLRKMKEYMLYNEDYDVDLLVQKIDAVLKADASK